MKTIDDAIQAFAAATDGPPNPALQWALAHWDEAAPRCLEMLEAYTDGTDESETTLDAMFFVAFRDGHSQFSKTFAEHTAAVKAAHAQRDSAAKR